MGEYKFVKYLMYPAAALFSWVFLTKTRTVSRPDMQLFKRYDYAHRGLHRQNGKEGDESVIPENSLSAFHAAINHGYGIETDVHLLSDGAIAAFHDASLKRMCDADVQIETLSTEELQEYRLLGTDERIPLLKELLALTDGKVPLLIEVKTEDGNVGELMDALAPLLDEYKGAFMLQSFDPRVLLWLRMNRRGWIRGQLSEFFKANGHPSISHLSDFLMRNMFANVAARPDFIAYRFLDRKRLTLRMLKFVFHAEVANWTIRSMMDYKAAKQEGNIAIFENILP